MYRIYCVCNKIILFGFLYFWGFLWYLENLPLGNTEWIFPVFVSLMTYLALGYIFLLDVSIFTTIDDEKEVKINSSSFLKNFIICIGVSTPTPQKHHPSLSCQVPLKSANCPSPLFRLLPLYIVFSWPPLFQPPKSRILQLTPKILKFFILITILSFKSN